MLTRSRALLGALLLVLALPLTACQGGGAQGPLTINVTITGDKVDPSGEVFAAGYGSEVSIKVSSDHDDVLHVHGYDVEISVKAGEQATRTFTADRTGRYEVETHSPVRTVGFLDVR